MEVQREADLRAANTFGVAARCAWRVQVDDAAGLAAFLDDARWRGLPRLVLGGGSNVLFVTERFPGVVLQWRGRGIRLLDADDEHWLVEAAGGEPWHPFVQHCIAQGWAGLENLSLIPGTVGAAPVQNIGAYGLELAERFDSLSAVDLETGETRRWGREALQFAYRHSVFKALPADRYLITAVRLRLPRRPDWRLDYGGLRAALAEQAPARLDAAAIAAAVCRLRRRKLPDPARLGNAGSFFQNPLVPAARAEALRAEHPALPAFPQPDGRVKLSAAWLIERCGWRGRRRGAAGVSARHALVLVNHGGASGAELWALARDIRASVAERFGVTLVPEPRLIGAAP